MIIKSNKYHLLGFFIVFVSLLILTIYQLFVTPSFTRPPFLKVFKLKNLKQLFYQTPDIGQPKNFPNPNPLIIDCQTSCHFILNDQTIKALVANDPQAKITKLELKFFDDSKGLIGYQVPDLHNPSFYVLNLSGQLLQTIKLNLNQLRLLEFVNYYPQTSETLFKSIHQSNQTQEHWLYSANTPSLRQITL